MARSSRRRARTQARGLGAPANGLAAAPGRDLARVRWPSSRDAWRARHSTRSARSRRLARPAARDRQGARAACRRGRFGARTRDGGAGRTPRQRPAPVHRPADRTARPRRPRRRAKCWPGWPRTTPCASRSTRAAPRCGRRRAQRRAGRAEGRHRQRRPHARRRPAGRRRDRRTGRRRRRARRQPRARPGAAAAGVERHGARRSCCARALLGYLAVAHHGRGRGEWVESEHPAFWSDAVGAVVGERRGALHAAWADRLGVRPASPESAALAAALQAWFDEASAQLLARLYPEAPPLGAPNPG